MLKKFISFTLAEVLLVAAIAAVIGALTVPNINKSYNKKANLTKAKSVLAKLDTAMQNSNMPNALRGLASNTDSDAYEKWSNAAMDELSQYLKLRVNCGTAIVAGASCFASNYTETAIISTTFKKNDVTTNDSCARAIINDGTEFVLCIADSTGSDNGSFIVIDVDGQQKGSQTRGQDIFEFLIEDGNVRIQEGSIEAQVLN